MTSHIGPNFTGRVPSSFCWSVCLCILVTTMYCGKMADSVEMLFEVGVGCPPGTLYLMGVQIPQGKGHIFREIGWCSVMYRENVASAVQRLLLWWSCHLGWWLVSGLGSVSELCIRWPLPGNYGWAIVCVTAMSVCHRLVTRPVLLLFTQELVDRLGTL